jgi:hypothetical protein
MQRKSLKRVNKRIVGFLVIFPCMAAATESPAQLCEDAADMATAHLNIPGHILRAIALTETGRNVDGRLRPWPWVLNVGGDAVWFQTQAAAVDHANNLIASGVTNFDIGCFQLNFRWHAANFDSLNSMIDPDNNALYAARFLTQKFASLGSWGDAVGAYHSATTAHASAYLARFQEIYSNIATFSAPASVERVAQDTPRNVSANRFPLLVPGHRGNGGSLVPALNEARPLFGDRE